MRGLVGTASFVAIAFVLVAPGCDREDLVVATVSAPVSSDASAVDGGDDETGAHCSEDDDCHLSDERCEKRGCADRGFCEEPSCGSPLAFGPACGCNKVSYYNDCEREIEGNGVSQLSPYACQGDSATPCSADADCRAAGLPPNAVCSLLVVGEHACDKEVHGTCWVLPSDCSEVTSDGSFYRPCSDDSAPCLNLCQAIRSGQPVVYDVECQP